MTKKSLMYLSLAVFSLGLGMGISKPGLASGGCGMECRSEYSACIHDCVYKDGVCYARCQTEYQSCLAGC